MNLVPARISDFASWTPSILRPAASAEAVFFILPFPSEFGGPGRTPLGRFRVHRNTEVPHSKRIPIHLSVPLLTSSCLLRRRGVLSGRRRQRLHPPEHGPRKSRGMHGQRCDTKRITVLKNVNSAQMSLLTRLRDCARISSQQSRGTGALSGVRGAGRWQHRPMRAKVKPSGVESYAAALTEGEISDSATRLFSLT